MDEPEMKIIDVFICKLLKKLARAGADNLIGTIWGRGYMLRDPNQEPTFLHAEMSDQAFEEHQLQDLAVDDHADAV
jgi:hypothetical protein